MNFRFESLVFFIVIAALTFLAQLALFLFFWFWFVVAKPAQWARIVEKENNFWVRIGVISEKFAGRCKRFEQGPGQKVLVGIGGSLAFGGFLFIIWIWLQANG